MHLGLNWPYPVSFVSLAFEAMKQVVKIPPLIHVKAVLREKGVLTNKSTKVKSRLAMCNNCLW